MRQRKPWIAMTCVVALLTAPALPLFAQSSGSPFDKACKAVRQDPDNVSLRKKVFALMRDRKSLPDTPDEVSILKGKATYIMKNANSQADYGPAVDAFKKASAMAPWIPELYYDLGVVQQKAGEPEDATSSFKLYLAADPEASDRDKVLARLGELEVQQEKHQETTAAVVTKRQATTADLAAHKKWESQQTGSIVVGVLSGITMGLGAIFWGIGLGDESSAKYTTSPGYSSGVLYNIHYENKYWSSASYAQYTQGESEVGSGLLIGGIGLLGVVLAVVMSPGAEPRVSLLDVQGGKLAMGLPTVEMNAPMNGFQTTLLHAEF